MSVRKRCGRSGQSKAGDKFYKMDEESIVTIREELSEDFFALAEAHLKEVRGLVEVLDDGQLDAQLHSRKIRAGPSVVGSRGKNNAHHNK